MKKLLFLLMLAAVLVLAGCGKDPMSSKPSNNSEFAVDLLFEHDGCKVYRFYDHGHPVYFVKPTNGNPAQTSWNEIRPAGKTVYTVPRNVQTVAE